MVFCQETGGGVDHSALNTINEVLVDREDDYDALSNGTTEELAVHPPGSAYAASTHAVSPETERDKPIHDDSVHSVLGF